MLLIGMDNRWLISCIFSTKNRHAAMLEYGGKRKNKKEKTSSKKRKKTYSKHKSSSL